MFVETRCPCLTTATHFLGPLLQNARAELALGFPFDLFSVQRHRHC